MDLIADYLKNTFRLISPFFLLGVVTIGVVLLYIPRTRVWGRRWLAAAVVGFWFVSTPIGSWALSAPLASKAQRIELPEQAAGADVVVVLGGGIQSYGADGLAVDDLAAGALRVIEGARLYRLLGHPLVIVSGGNRGYLKVPRLEAAAYRRGILELGVPADRIIVEDQSQTTRGQALELKEILISRKVDRFVLVTDPTHMLRSLATFRAAGMNPIPSASRSRSDRNRVPWTLRPDHESLAVSDSAAYEYAALVYYWLKGWM